MHQTETVKYQATSISSCDKCPFDNNYLCVLYSLGTSQQKWDRRATTEKELDLLFLSHGSVMIRTPELVWSRELKLLYFVAALSNIFVWTIYLADNKQFIFDDNNIIRMIDKPYNVSNL